MFLKKEIRFKIGLIEKNLIVFFEDFIDVHNFHQLSSISSAFKTLTSFHQLSPAFFRFRLEKCRAPALFLPQLSTSTQSRPWFRRETTRTSTQLVSPSLDGIIGQ
jgi:hypothetical protein